MLLIDLLGMDFNLLRKYLEGNTSQTERDEVFRWIKSSSENENEFNKLRRLQDISVWHFSENRSILSDKKRRKIISPAFLRITAIFLLGIVLSVFVYRRNNLGQDEDKVSNDKAIGMQQISVPAGQSVKLLLTDGTKVWLNSKSRLVFPRSFDGRQRVVQLYGEGFFEVAHDPEHPFIVEVEPYSVKVKGTEFNVKAYDTAETFETSLLSGSVEINMKEESESLLLKPLECAIITNNEVRVTSFDLNNFLWRDGILYLDNKSIHEIALLLEQYYDTKINIVGGRRMKRKYTGKFRLQDGVSHILKVLELQNDFKFKNDTINNLITIE
ncbi:FecR family protein [Proteiniphilum sp.]|nr:FecR family protein [Proteiniphilum sp.]MEA4919245.1 FecR family protein [Proteiniphilum sp.]